MIIALVPALIVVGMLVYLFADVTPWRGKVAELGRILFACAVLVWLYYQVGHMR